VAEFLGRMLVVEEDALARRIVAKRFARSGWSVQVTSTDEEALELLDAAAGDVDIVVTDRLPLTFSGFDLAKRIREIPGPVGATAVVVVSGLDRPSDIASVLAAGADGFVSRPFDLADLESEIERVLKVRSAADDGQVGRT